MTETLAVIQHAAEGVVGYIYPNESELHWSILIVLYPYLTGLVAGAFILASLERVFSVSAVRPTYRLALITALSFLIAAPLPLLAHLSKPWRFWEVLVTPHVTSAMAMFGFVYMWYLLVVLILEIWFEYRRDFVVWSNAGSGGKRRLYGWLTLGVRDVSEPVVRFDETAIRVISVIGIPSAFLLHGYVGFIFGSIKANPWWSSVLMPVIFLFSAIVSGIALVMLIFLVSNVLRKITPDMECIDTLGRYLFYAFIVDFALEGLDVIQRTYASEESFDVLYALVHGRLFETHIIFQILLGTLIPIALLGIIQVTRVSKPIRLAIYWFVGFLVQVGIFFMRWNVVIGGQLFSKSFRGFTIYKLGLIGREGGLAALLLFLLPFAILMFLIWLLPPWQETHRPTTNIPSSVRDAQAIIES
ncbi:MAG TPA: NrfD/PsrC family molybdoenzyme membrane anchor subunit [bacterium]|jgi:predicted membrane protein